MTVRGYFFPNDPDRQFELAMLVRRLQRMDVEVRQLNQPVTLTDFHPYGDPAHGVTYPAGTYWVPMAQAQKHWVQAMLHEEDWIPFDVTYDVTAWSNPLLMNLNGGWSGDVVPLVGLGRRRRGRHADVGAALRASRRSGSSRSRTAPAASSRPARRATCSTTSGTCRRTT